MLKNSEHYFVEMIMEETCVDPVSWNLYYFV